MKVVYIAGPYRGHLMPDGQYNQWEQFENIRRAERDALRVWSMGAAAICPHTNTAHFQGALPDHCWLDGDLEIMSRCDAVLMVDGWQQSAGALAERKQAMKLNLPVFYNFGELEYWLKGKHLEGASRLC